jgi:hypothetical protein
MGDDYGQEIGEALDLGPDEEISAESEGEIEHPHQHSSSDSSEPHVDAHHITTDSKGRASSEKIHSDDK